MDSIRKNCSIKQTVNLLKYTFGIVPIVAGMDKFTNLLTIWEQYMPATISHLLPFSDSRFMMGVGIVEIVAGVVVLKKPQVGGYIVAAWLTMIAITLLFEFNYIDVAIRDLVLAISALSMARLSRITR